MPAHAERGMSAPPEVVFGTATDPDRVSAWLPEPLRQDGDQRSEASAEELRAQWSSASTPGWSVELWVEPADAGGARVRLALNGDPEQQGSAALAAEILANLAREVADNLTTG